MWLASKILWRWNFAPQARDKRILSIRVGCHGRKEISKITLIPCLHYRSVFPTFGCHRMHFKYMFFFFAVPSFCKILSPLNLKRKANERDCKCDPYIKFHALYRIVEYLDKSLKGRLVFVEVTVKVLF